MSDTKFRDKVVVIAGGAKNLGGLLTSHFLEQGARVLVHYHSDSSREDAEKTVNLGSNLDGEAAAVQADLTKPAQVKKLFDEAENRFGPVDIAINTTGMVLRKPIAEIDEDEYDSMFDINAKAAFFFIQQAGKRLKDHGKIISIGTSLQAAFTA